MCTGLIIAGFAFTSFGPLKQASAASVCTQGTTLNIVAHEDDDLLFLSPDLLHAIQSGRCVRTIFVTAGDNGENASYWQTREQGPQAAYAQMAGVANTWTQADAGISGHPIAVFTLTGKPNISLAYMQIPDGNIDGSGFISTNNESLQDLWTGTISTIHTIDGSSSYTKATLTSTLTSLMTAFQPDQINTQDYVGSYGDGDHSDHHTVGYFTQAAQQLYTTAHTLTGYKDYATSSLNVNVAGTDLVNKQAAFLTYALDDPNVCQNAVDCAATNYGLWLQRQYMVSAQSNGANQLPIADPGGNQIVLMNTNVQLDGSGSSASNGNALTDQWTQVSGPSVTLSSATAVQPTFTTPGSAATLIFQLVVNDGQNNSNAALVTLTVTSSPDLALAATATASSSASGQTADKAIDGVIDGYPGDSSKEWSTNGGGTGSWLKLSWTSPQTMSRIVLHDRLNLNDQITAGNIQFSDGSSVSVGTLSNDGSGVIITFPSKTATSLQFNITSVSSSTQNVGLAEVEVYQDIVVSPPSLPPLANAGPDQTIQVNAPVLLDGSASSASNGKSLTYQWTQTAGSGVTLSSTTAQQPGFTAPSYATTLTFQLVVNDGQNSSNPDTITITVHNNANLALSATATASSQNTILSQTANKAIDGVVSSSLFDFSHEWATTNGKAGSWLKLSWTNPQIVSRIVLHDRPNLVDQITGGTIQFSDGSSVPVGTLNNNGTGVTITFPARTITNLQLNISSVSRWTQNVGLAEIEVYQDTTSIVSTPGNADVALSATATASSQNTILGQTANKAIDGVVSNSLFDFSHEWATINGKAGSWLKLSWTTPQTVSRIVLYDRSNLTDQITGGTIQFSDGSSVLVGTLSNNGTGTTLTFPTKTITRLQLNVTSVGRSTQSVGLAEIQVYGS